ncbi:MAG: radical SAM protein [Methylobacter sp.]
MKLRRGPDGIHLFDRKSGTNILIDEQIPLMSSWTNCPRQVSIALTNACDLKCAHCYALKRRAQLSKEQVKHWMAELDETGCFGIGFGGGEPTLHPDLVEPCQFGQRETGLAISLTTHGHRLTDSLISQLRGLLILFG